VAPGFKTGGRVARDVGERFWEKVDRNGPIPEHLPALGQCWVWMKKIHATGYGQFALRPRVSYEAHRVAYFLSTGFMSTRNQCLDHLCRNKACVNPSHLEVVTNQVNVIRGKSCALKKLATHCPHGHEMTPENRRAPQKTSSGAIVPGGCKTCHRERENARNAKNRRAA
jgi:hypothetical protein